jgi:DNA-binding NarL/FixJ family response regulator
MPRSTTQRPERPGGISVALVDGVPLFRDGLSALVQRTPGMRWVGAADRQTAALQLWERYEPDVMVIDSGLDPRGQLCHLLAEHEDLGLLVLVQEAHRDTQYLAAALAAGVHGLVPRSAEGNQVVGAIRAVYEEGRYLDPRLAPVLSTPRGKLKHWPGPTKQPLSKREYQVLRLIADGLENQSIAKILFVSVETVRTHVKSILRKLGARDRTHAVAVAFRTGVLTAAPPANEETTAGA